MTNKTESIGGNTPFNLENTQSGSLIKITQGNLTAFVDLVGFPGEEVYFIANGTPPPGAISTFILTIYSFGQQSKVSLQPLGMEELWWSAGENVYGVAYPIMLLPNPETFIITEVIEGYTIERAVGPPGHYIHGYDQGITFLTYGHDQPLIQGLFNIEIIG